MMTDQARQHITSKAWLYYNRDDFAPALQAAREGLEIDPFDEELLFLAGMSAIGAKQLTVAEPAIATLLEQYPNSSRSHLAAGFLRERQKKKPQAELHFRQMIELEPNSAEYRAVLGMFLGWQIRCEEGITVARKGLKMDPESPTVLHALQQLYRLNKEPDMAEKFEQRALEISPESSAAHFEAGLRLLEKGHNQQAKFSLLESLRSNPSDQESLAIIAHERVRTHPFFKKGFLLAFKWEIQLMGLASVFFWFVLSLLFKPFAYIGWLALIIFVAADLYHGLFLLCRKLALKRIQSGRL